MLLYSSLFDINFKKLYLITQIYLFTKKNEVLPRFELGSMDSKSNVLTVTP